MFFYVTLKYPTIKSHDSPSKGSRTTIPKRSQNKLPGSIRDPFWVGENVTLSKANRDLQRGSKGHELNQLEKDKSKDFMISTGAEYPDYKHTTAYQDLPGLNSFAISLVGFSWIFGVNFRQKPTTTSGKSKLLQAHPVNWTTRQGSSKAGMKLQMLLQHFVCIFMCFLFKTKM